jgi:hypothetical protein
MPVAGKTWTARKVTLGAFTLSSAQVNLIDRSEPLAAEDSHPAELPRRAKFEDGGYYLGGDSSTPVVGDERITFQVVRPGTISVIGRQVGDSFEPYHAEAGDDILMVNDGTVSAASMFTAAQEANTQLAWILRGAGFLLMALGLGLIFSPLSVMADVVPLFGTLLRSGTFLFAITIAASLSLITVALSWLAYRPLLGGGLLVAAGAGVFVLHRMGSARKT